MAASRLQPALFSILPSRSRQGAVADFHTLRWHRLQPVSWGRGRKRLPAPHNPFPPTDERYVETSQTGEYLTFRVARQDFAMLTSRVRGILPAREMIHIDAPEFSTSRLAFVTAEFSNSAPGFSNSAMICGVASLRGRDFPVVDLRGKLGIAHGSHGRQPCLIVVEAGSGSGARLIGFVADRISEVLMLRDRDFRKGSVRVNGRSRRVLDPDLILTDEELARCWNASLLPIR